MIPSTPNSKFSPSPISASKAPTSRPNPEGLGISMSYPMPSGRQYPCQWNKAEVKVDNFSNYYGTPPLTPMPNVNSWSPHSGVEDMFDPTYFPSTPVDDNFFLPTTNAYGHGSANDFFPVKHGDPMYQYLQGYSGGSGNFGMQAPHDSCIAPALSFLRSSTPC